MHVHAFLYVRVSMYVLLNVRMHARMRAFIFICMCMCVCVTDRQNVCATCAFCYVCMWGREGNGTKAVSQIMCLCGVHKGLGTRCNFLTSATSGLPQVAIQIEVLAAHVATLIRSPRNPIPNKENSRGTIRDFSFASKWGHTKCHVVIGYNTATFLQG